MGFVPHLLADLLSGVDLSNNDTHTTLLHEAGDYAQVRALLQANNRAACPLAILDWCRFITQANAETLPILRLWMDENGDLDAFVWPDFGGSEIITRGGDDVSFARILAWEVAYVDVGVLRVVMDERDVARSTLLGERGYRPAPEISFYAVRSLNEPIASPRLPEGYAFACVSDLPNLEGRVATERAAMQWSPTTASFYRAIQQTPDYRADLDLVVVDATGGVAAFCTFWAEPDEGIGVVEPIGSHPAHQRRGLGSALLYYGMIRLKTLGMSEVYVGNGPVPETLETPGSPRQLTASVGFRHVTRKYTWVHHM